MTQKEAVELTLERLGGIATLAQLYKETFEIKECVWKTKTHLHLYVKLFNWTKIFIKLNLVYML